MSGGSFGNATGRVGRRPGASALSVAAPASCPVFSRCDPPPADSSLPVGVTVSSLDLAGQTPLGPDGSGP